MKTVTIEEVEHIAFKLAQMKLSYDEAMPDFATRFPNILEELSYHAFAAGFGQTFVSIISFQGWDTFLPDD